MIGRPLRRQDDARLLRGQAYWLLYVELGELVAIFGSASLVTATVPAGPPTST